MFGDPNSNTPKYEKCPIGDMCFVTKLAGFEYTKCIHYQETGEVVMVKAQNVKNGTLNEKDLSYISNEVSDSLPRSQCKVGDVVMTYVGANIGDVAIIDNKYKYHLAPNVARISPNNEKINSNYLMHLLVLLRNYIVGNSADTAKAALPMSKIRQLEILVPPIETQKQFADFAKDLNKSKVVIENMIKFIENMYI